MMDENLKQNNDESKSKRLKSDDLGDFLGWCESMNINISTDKVCSKNFDSFNMV